jgi:hypothetical protein
LWLVAQDIEHSIKALDGKFPGYYPKQSRLVHRERYKDDIGALSARFLKRAASLRMILESMADKITLDQLRTQC